MIKKNLLGFLIVSTILLLVLSQFNYLLFHFVLEFATVFIGIMLFIIAINTEEYSKRSVLLSLGVAYLYISALDFMHIISYDGINIITSTPVMSKSFWVAARLLEAANIAIILFLYRNGRIMKYINSHIGHLLYVITACIFIFYDLVPTNFTNNIAHGMLIFVEIGIGLFYLIGIYFAVKGTYTKDHKALLVTAIVLKLLSELIFAIYSEDLAVIGELGLTLKYMSYGLIYLIFIHQTVADPYSNMYSLFQRRTEELIHLSEIDRLTGVYNHTITQIKLEELVEKYKHKNGSIFVTMIDLDDFKIVNDTYGHQKGDEVLKQFARELLKSQYDDRVVGRYGGDEFIIAGVYDSHIDSQASFKEFSKRLRSIQDELGIDFSFSAGTALYSIGDTAKDLVYKADIKMYESKRLGKNRVSLWESE